MEDYEPDNLLLRQAYTEVFNNQLEEVRLREALREFLPLKLYSREKPQIYTTEFPIKVDSLRQSLSSEDLLTRIERMKTAGIPKKKSFFSIIFSIFAT